MREIGTITVRNYKGQPIPHVNELEFVDGKIWANVFGVNYLVAINPTTGYIEDAIDFQALQEAEMNYVKAASNGDLRGYDFGNNVFNGVAYDPETRDWYVTGKRWNLLFKVHLH